MACRAGAGSKSALKVKVQDGPELYVCRLSEGRQDFANLDLVLDEYTEFTVEGAALHITGAILNDACMSQCRPLSQAAFTYSLCGSPRVTPYQLL